MGNITPVDISYYNSFADELMGKFKRLSHLTAHGGSNGNYHEEILRSLLRNFLTTRYAVKTGFIYKDANNISNQLDIMIVDENSPAAYIFQEGDFAVVLPSAVVAYIEVKTTFSAKEFDGSIKNIASAKRLAENPYDHCGIVFGYQNDTTPNDDRIGGWFERPSTKDLAANNTLGPNAIILLKDNYSLFRYNTVTTKIGDGLSYHRFSCTEPTEIGWQLSYMLAMVIGANEHRDFQTTHQFGRNQANNLVSTGTLDVSDDEFVFGIGKRKPAKS